jgi:hypothetical protein
MAVVMEMVDLPLGKIDDRGVASLSKFFVDMVGKLEVVNLRVIERLMHEGTEIAGQLAGAILPRVHFLTPDFPFNQLFDYFEDDDDRIATEIAVAEYVADAKEWMRRQ